MQNKRVLISSERDHAIAERGRIEGIVAGYVAKNPDAALVVGITRGNRKQIYGWGRIGPECALTPTAETVFEIGSITKVFTANLLADFACAGRLRLYDPASKYLPAGVRMPTYRGVDITLFHLATHTSSLPRLPKNLWKTVKDDKNPYANYQVGDLYEFLSGCRLRRMVGSRVAYSNLGMGLLGHILALIDGRPYERVVIERICVPLGMTDTSISLSDDQQQRLAQGHNAAGEPAPKWDLPTLAGAGALCSTATDMLLYLEANLGSAPAAITPALIKCQLMRPRTAKPGATWQDFLVAAVLAGCGLASREVVADPAGLHQFSAVISAAGCYRCVARRPVAGALRWRNMRGGRVWPLGESV